MITSLSQAQVIISNQENPTPTNSSVLLEFGNNENKGIILPVIATPVTESVNGTFLVNSTTKAVQMKQDDVWIDLTDEDEAVIHSHTNTGEEIGKGVIIGSETTDKPGVLVLESTDKALVLPRVANPHLTILSPIAGTVVYDTTSDSLAVYDGKNWSFWAAK